MIENDGADVNLTVEEGSAPVKDRGWIRRHWVPILIISAILAFSVTIYMTGAMIGDVEGYGYLGVFLISVLAAAVLIVPVPGLPVVFLMGAILNPWLVGLMAGLGEPIGEIPPYVAGYSGRASMERSKIYVKLNAWVKRRGTLVLFIFAAIPNVIFDLVAAAAGALRYPFWKFLLVLFLGKTVKGLIVAFAGYWTLRLILQFLIG